MLSAKSKLVSCTSDVYLAGYITLATSKPAFRNLLVLFRVGECVKPASSM